MKVLIIILLLFATSCHKHEKVRVGCKDTRATNYDPQAEEDCSNCCNIPEVKRGGVLFWTSFDELVFGAGGAMIVKFSDGRSTTISGFYNIAPLNCINQVGGYILLEVGEYSFQVFAADNRTQISGGIITVFEGCNKFKISL